MKISAFGWKENQNGYFVSSNGKYRYTSGDDDNTLRKKCACVFVCSLTGHLLLRPVTRIFFLLTGSWALSGIKKANEIWLKEWAAHYDKSTPPPRSLKAIAAQQIAKEFVKDIAQCVTQPFAAIAVAFSSLWGMIVPKDGRALIGLIEHTWAIELPNWADCALMMRVVNYAASCMQTVDSWKKKDLFRYLPRNTYHPGTMRSLLSQIERLHEWGISHLPQDTPFDRWRKTIHQIEQYDADELAENGELKQEPKYQVARMTLQLLLDACNEYNEAILKAAKSGHKINHIGQFQGKVKIVSKETSMILLPGVLHNPY